jgi:hypothetical protein
MKRFTLLLTIAAIQTLNAQNGGGVPIAVPSPPGPQVAANQVGAPGTLPYYYTVIVHYPSGTVQSTIATIANGTTTLNGTNYNQLSWPALPGALTYDVLRLPTNAFTGSCTCSIATGLTALNFSDQGGSLSSYTVGAPALAANAAIFVDNTDYNFPKLRVSIGNQPQGMNAEHMAEVPSGISLPPYCKVGDPFILTSGSPNYYYCLPANTWNASGSSTPFFLALCQNNPSIDDRPALQAATNSAGSAGGGTVFILGGHCYINSFTSQVIGVEIPFVTPITYEGNNATITLNASLTNGAPFGSVPLLTSNLTYDAQPLKLWNGANIPQYSSSLTLTTPSDCSFFQNYGDYIWIKGGLGSGMEANAEQNQVATCNLSTGVMQLIYPTAKKYVNDGTNLYGVSNVQAITFVNPTFEHMTIVTGGAGIIAQYQTFGLTFRDVTMIQNLGNQMIVSGSLRHVVLDNVKWKSPYNTSLTFHGSGGYQIAYNTVDVTVQNSSLSTPDWESGTITCTEFSAQIKIVNNTISGQQGIGATNCFDVQWLNNTIQLNIGTLTGYQGAFINGVCCGSNDVPNSTAIGNNFWINTPAGATTGLNIGGTAYRFENNQIHFSSGGLGTAFDLGDPGIQDNFEGNSIITDNNCINVAATTHVDWTIKNNHCTGVAAATATGTATINTNTVVIAGASATIQVGWGISGAGIPDGSYVNSVSGANVVINGAQGLGPTVFYANLSATPLTFTFAGTNGLIFQTSSMQNGAGMAVDGNTFENFYFGIQANANLTLFPNRAFGYTNSFAHVGTQYTPAGLAPVVTGPNGSVITYAPGNAVYYNPFYSQMYGGRCLWTLVGTSGVTPQSDEICTFESTGNASIGLHGAVGSHNSMYMSDPTHRAAISYDTSTQILGFSIDTIGVPNSTTLYGEMTSQGFRPINTSIGYFSIDGTSGVTGSTCTAWKNGLCVTN